MVWKCKRNCAKQSSRTKEKKLQVRNRIGNSSENQLAINPSDTFQMQNVKVQEFTGYHGVLYSTFLTLQICSTEISSPTCIRQWDNIWSSAFGIIKQVNPAADAIITQGCSTLVVYHQFCHLDVFRFLISCIIIITNQTSQIFHHQGTLTSFGGMFWLSLKQRTLVSPSFIFMAWWQKSLIHIGDQCSHELRSPGTHQFWRSILSKARLSRLMSRPEVKANHIGAVGGELCLGAPQRISRKQLLVALQGVTSFPSAFNCLQVRQKKWWLEGSLDLGPKLACPGGDSFAA